MTDPIDFGDQPDPMTLDCPHCGDTLEISHENLDRLFRAALALHPEGSQVEMDISKVGPGDWTQPATPQMIGRALGAFRLAEDAPSGGWVV